MKMVKNSLITTLTFVLSVGSFGTALALEGSAGADAVVTSANTVSVDATTSLRVDVRTSDRDDDDDESDSREKSSEVRTLQSGTSSKVNDSDDDKDSRGTSTATSSRSQGDEHRSEVATFVQNLLRIANRDGGIGKLVREVARDEASSSASTSEAIRKVETRGKFKTFLIGSDFKNLGVIRSELARTDKSLERLSALASSTTDVTVRAELSAQIKALQDSQAKVKAFVDANENTFSLLGWFVRIFNK